jgi:hypothetical protein
LKVARQTRDELAVNQRARGPSVSRETY